MTKCHGLDGLNNRNYILKVLEAGKSKIKVWQESVSDKSSLPGL